MDKNKPSVVEFTSRLTPLEAAAVLCYLPMHILGIPLMASYGVTQGWLSYADANFFCYLLGVMFMMMFAVGFLRRDYDPLCDRSFFVFVQILSHYGLMLCFNYVVSLIFTMAIPEMENQNNNALMLLAGEGYGKMLAMTVFLAPIVEEVMFRGGIFGILRYRNRNLAYVVSMLAFSIYHVWGFALTDPLYWIFILQYLPVSYLLCRIYERTNTIWSSIFMHMLINGISIKALEALQEMM